MNIKPHEKEKVQLVQLRKQAETDIQVESKTTLDTPLGVAA